jgi:hypothetical protein
MPRARVFVRPIPALLLLAVLGLTAAAHFGHHLLDPECESGEQGGGHPCVQCSALHAAAIAEQAVAPAPPAFFVATRLAHAADGAPSRPTRRPGAPRAPPAA